jgi:hypothetical protein
MGENFKNSQKFSMANGAMQLFVLCGCVEVSALGRIKPAFWHERGHPNKSKRRCQ